MGKIADRYEQIQAQAHATGLEVRVVVVPGPIKKGEQILTYLPFEGEPAPLGKALDLIEDYINSDEARNRALLYRRRRDAQRWVAETQAQLITARKLWLNASEAVKNDTRAALGESELSDDRALAREGAAASTGPRHFDAIESVSQPTTETTPQA